MKKTAAMLLAVLMLLCGCANAQNQINRAVELRSRLLGSSCSFTVAITADYGDKVHMFTMDCEGDPQGNITFTVTQPETISGITGTIDQDGGKLTFDDFALQFDLLADDQVSPVSAPWILLKTLRGGYLTSAGEEGDLLRVTINDSYEEDALQLDIWLDAENKPVQADVLYDGSRILSLTVSNFQIG